MLGVDVGKDALYGTWRDPKTQRIRWQGEEPNTAAGIRRLLKRAPGSDVVVEPTGRYGEPLIRVAQACGGVVCRALSTSPQVSARNLPRLPLDTRP